MKPIIALALSLTLFAPAAVIAAPKKLHQRAWLGGEFKLATRGGEPVSPTRVGAFPQELQQHSGVFVSAVHAGTPLAAAGVVVGDLIIGLDDRPVTYAKALRSAVEARAPGDRIRLAVYRDGSTEEHRATLGIESYERSRNIGLGLMFSSKIDLVPNPDFSAIAVGFNHRDRRVELNSPEVNFFLRHRRGKGHEMGLAGDEGWQAWCVIFSFGSHKRIVSQELFDSEKSRASLR